MTRRHVLIGALVLTALLVESHAALAQGRSGGRSFGVRPQGPLFRSRGENESNNNNSQHNFNPSTEKDGARSPVTDSQRSVVLKPSGDANQSSQSIDTKDIALKGATPKPFMKLTLALEKGWRDEDRAQEKLAL